MDRKNMKGATTVEYAVMLVLIVVAVVTIVTLLGETVNSSFNDVNNSIN